MTMTPNATLLLADARRLAKEAAERNEAARRALVAAEAAEQARLEGMGLAEPTGEGYVYVALHLGNGAQMMAKRSPNGVWWWEPYAGEEGGRTWGAWGVLVDQVKPAGVTVLLPAAGQ